MNRSEFITFIVSMLLVVSLLACLTNILLLGRILDALVPLRIELGRILAALVVLRAELRKIADEKTHITFHASGKSEVRK